MAVRTKDGIVNIDDSQANAFVISFQIVGRRLGLLYIRH
jgi:hypothetical protein